MTPVGGEATGEASGASGDLGHNEMGSCSTQTTSTKTPGGLDLPLGLGELPTKGVVIGEAPVSRDATKVSGPKNGPKQLRVFQRKEVSSPKPTKSWVTERYSWNDGKGGDLLLVGWLGKKPSDCLAYGEVSASVAAAMGESKETGLLGVMED